MAALATQTSIRAMRHIALSLLDENWELPAFSIQEFFPRRTRYSWIIPVLNEGERIRTQLVRMRAHKDLGDIVIVDGGSTDNGTDPEFLRQMGVRALLVKKSAGRQSAQLRIGLAYILREGYDGSVLMDGNNKDNPDSVAKFIKALDDGYDHIQGSRFLPGGRHENTPLIRNLGIRYLHAPMISRASGFKYTDTTNGFKAFSRRLLIDPRVNPFRSVFDSYELHSYLQVRAGGLGFRLMEIPVCRIYPSKGPAPTKISKFGGSMLMFKILFRACLHKYDPVAQSAVDTTESVNSQSPVRKAI